jgi:hypothetical protein
MAHGEAAVLAEMALQHGVISEARAVELGMTRSTILRRKREGRLVATHHGVVRSGGAPLSWLGALQSAVLSTDGIVSHRSAAALLGVSEAARRWVEVTVPFGHHVVRPGVVVHESTQFDLIEPTRRLGIPVTDPYRLLVDLGAVQPQRLEATLDDFLLRHQVEWMRLYRTFIRHAARGRDGIGPLRALLDERFGDTQIPLSRWSRDVADLLVLAGLPAPTLEYRVIGSDGRLVAQVDLAYPEQRLAIELQSKRHHLNGDAFVRDARRFNALVNAGWRPLSFTWSDYADHPRQLCRTVRTALA